MSTLTVTKKRNAIAMAVIVITWLAGCGADETSSEALRVQQKFLTQQYAEVQSIVESRQFPAHDAPYIYGMYCHSLRELGYSLKMVEDGQVGRALPQGYGVALCDLAFGNLERARGGFLNLITDEKMRNHAHYGLLEYAAVTGNPQFMDEMLAAIKGLEDKPDFLISFERLMPLWVLYHRGEFEQLEREIKKLSRSDIKEIGYPAYFVAPLFRRNAFIEAQRYVDEGIADLGQAQHLYEIQADIIYYTKGRQAALDWLVKMTAMHPQMRALKYSKAMRLLESGERKEAESAIPLLNSIIDERSQDFEFLVDVANLLIDFEQWDTLLRVVKLLNAYGHELDQFVNYRVYRGRAFYLRGESAKALEQLREVVEVVPHHARALTLLFQYAHSVAHSECRRAALLGLLHVDPWNVGTLAALADNAENEVDLCCDAKYAATQLSFASRSRVVPEVLQIKSKSLLNKLGQSCLACDLNRPPTVERCDLLVNKFGAASGVWAVFKTGARP